MICVLQEVAIFLLQHCMHFCMHIICTTSHMCILSCSSMFLAMCAGIGAPGTLREILRGYFGDKKAPERFRDDDVVRAGFITIVSRM